MTTNDALLDIVLDKKELRGIDRDFAMNVLKKYLLLNKTIIAVYEEDPKRFSKKKEFRQVKQDVRGKLRHVYGVFIKPVSEEKKDRMVQQLIDQPTLEHANNILSTHRSSSERLSYYPTFFQEIFAITGEPKSILDLGCGLNPLAYDYMMIKPDYHCADIATTELKRIEKFLAAKGVTHSVHCLDLTDIEAVKKLPKVDVAFGLKLFDTLEDVRRNVTKELLEAIPAKYLVASFPTLTIGQRIPMRPRQWFDRLVTGKVAGTVTLPNEYLVIITL